MDKNEKIQFLKDFEKNTDNAKKISSFKKSSILKMWANVQNKKDILHDIKNSFELLSWDIVEQKNKQKTFLILIKDCNDFIFQEITFAHRKPISNNELNLKIIDNNIVVHEKNILDKPNSIGRENSENIIAYLAKQYFGLEKEYQKNKFVENLDRHFSAINIQPHKKDKNLKLFIDYLTEKYTTEEIVTKQAKNIFLFEKFIQYVQDENLIDLKEIEKNLPHFISKLPKNFDENSFRTLALMLLGIPMMESVFSSIHWDKIKDNNIKRGGIRCQALSQYIQEIKEALNNKKSEIDLSDVLSISLEMDNSQLSSEIDYFLKIKKIPALGFYLNDNTYYRKYSEEVSFVKSLAKSGNGDPRKYLTQFSNDKWDEIVTSLKDFFNWLRKLDHNCPEYEIKNYLQEVPFSKIIKDNQAWHHIWPALLSSYLKKDTVSWEGLITQAGMDYISQSLKCKAKELISKDDLDIEGNEQNNCVLTYLGYCANDFIRILSLKPYKNDVNISKNAFDRRATIEIVYKNNAIVPVQIKGYANKKITEDSIKNIFEALNKEPDKYFNPDVLQQLKQNSKRSKSLDSSDDNLILHYQKMNNMPVLENIFKNILDHINQEKELKLKDKKSSKNCY